MKSPLFSDSNQMSMASDSNYTSFGKNISQSVTYANITSNSGAAQTDPKSGLT